MTRKARQYAEPCSSHARARHGTSRSNTADLYATPPGQLVLPALYGGKCGYSAKPIKACDGALRRSTQHTTAHYILTQQVAGGYCSPHSGLQLTV